MARESYLDNSEFIELVRICLITRCTYIEALKILKSAGFTISAKTFQRAKNELEQARKKRIMQIADEFPEYAANTIDTARAIDYELWRIEKTSKNPWEKFKALEMLRRNCKDKAELFEGSPALSEFAKKRDSKVESEKTTSDVETEPTKKEDLIKYDVAKDTELDSS